MTLPRVLAVLLTTLMLMFTAAQTINAQDANKKIKLPEGTDLRASLDEAEVKKKTAPSEGWQITAVTLSYDPYIKRMQELLEYTAPRMAELKAKTLPLEEQYKVKKDKIAELKNLNLADYKSIKNKKLGKEEGYKIIDKRNEDIHALRLESIVISQESSEIETEIRNTQIAIDRLIDFMLADVQKDKSSRAVIREMQFAAGEQKSFEAHLNVDDEMLARLKALKMLMDKSVREAEDTAKSLQEKADSYNEKTRLPLIDKSSKAQADFVEKYNTFVLNLDLEFLALAFSQIGLDVAEVIVEGKNPVGFVIEIGSKAADAFYTYNKDPGDNQNNRQWKMYDSSALIKKYANTNRGSTQTFLENLKKRATMEQFGKTLALSVITKIAADPNDIRLEKMNVIEKLLESMKNSPLRTSNFQSEAFLRSAIKEGEKTLAKLNKELLQSQIQVFLAESGEKMAYKQLMEIEKTAAEKISQAIVVATLEKTARELALQKTQASLAKVAAEADSFKLKNFFSKDSKIFQKPEINAGKITSGIFKGMVWEGLRQGAQVAIEEYGKAYWTDFLEADIVVKMHHKNLSDATEEWEKLKLAARLAEVNIFMMKNLQYYAHVKEQLYLSEQSALSGLHIVHNQALTKGDGASVTFKTAGTTSRGHKVTLSGDKGSVILTSGAKQEPWDKPWNVDYETMKMETGFMRELSNTYTYKLPPGKTLSDISDDGKLRMGIVYQ